MHRDIDDQIRETASKLGFQIETLSVAIKILIFHGDICPYYKSFMEKRKKKRKYTNMTQWVTEK